MIRVMIVDDHAMVRVGFRLLLQSVQDMEVVAEADSGAEALRLYDAVRPDVLIMDVAMGGASGLDATHRILARDPQARVLGLSAHEDSSFVRHMMKAGALGYLSKRSAPESLLDAVRAVHARRPWIDPLLAQQLALQSVCGTGDSPLSRLSEREFEVFLHLARGLSVNRIAELLSLSPRTVGTHLYNVKHKLEAGNQAELTLIAIRQRLIELPGAGGG
ncbi:response regulator transcription factor [Caldimonas tepidiphila]|uniref:response regulator n=1 Tax=Caldimonas tepidiphila TaxID=2315841 RepID=UPI001F0C3043|nr:response regulator transcription factor [Caldimonas tepidiphila]